MEALDFDACDAVCGGSEYTYMTCDDDDQCQCWLVYDEGTIPIGCVFLGYQYP